MQQLNKQTNIMFRSDQQRRAFFEIVPTLQPNRRSICKLPFPNDTVAYGY